MLGKPARLGLCSHSRHFLCRQHSVYTAGPFCDLQPARGRQFNSTLLTGPFVRSNDPDDPATLRPLPLRCRAHRERSSGAPSPAAHDVHGARPRS